MTGKVREFCYRKPAETCCNWWCVRNVVSVSLGM